MIDKAFSEKLIFCSKRAYESGNFNVILHNVCWSSQDAGWVILTGDEPDLLFVNPGQSVLLSVQRVVEKVPALEEILVPEPKEEGYTLDKATGNYVPFDVPETYLSDLGLSW